MKVVAQNRRVKFDYEILRTIEAGVILTGPEVKSCRLGQVQIRGGYVSFLSGKPILRGIEIAPYVKAPNIEGYDPKRERVLLLKKTDIDDLQETEETRGLTIVPFEVRAGRFIKILLAVVRGRKTHDKRSRIKEREMQRFTAQYIDD